MRFPILPDSGPEAPDYSTLRYDLATKRWVPGPVVNPAEVSAMRTTLDDYQAGQNATDTAVASVLTAEGQARTVVDGLLAPRVQTDRREHLSTLANLSAGGWLLFKRNADDYHLIRELNDGYYSDAQVGRLGLGPTSMTPKPLLMQGVGIGMPMTTASVYDGVRTGTGWTRTSKYANGADTPPVTFGVHPETKTVGTTAGSNVITVSPPFSPLANYTGRSIIIPGAGAGGADLLATINDPAGNYISPAPSTTVSGVTATIYPARVTSAVVGDQIAYTTPPGSTRVGVLHGLSGAGGLATVAINGDLTRATALPTAQEYVNAGIAAPSILTTNGGTIAPTTRLLDSYEMWEKFMAWRALATDLPAGTHTVTLTVVNAKNIRSFLNRVYVAGFGHGSPTTDIKHKDVGVFLTELVSSQQPTNELAIDHQPSGTTRHVFVGGFAHGYERESAPALVTVDGSPTALADGATVAPSNLTLTRYSDLFHPDDTTNRSLSVRTTYRTTRDGLAIDQALLWHQASVVDSGYMVMFTVPRMTLDRVQLDRSTVGHDLSDTATYPHQTYIEPGKHTSAVWWDSDGTTVCAVMVPTAEQITGGWSESQLMVTVASLVDVGNSKLYVRRVGTVVAGDRWASRATIAIGRLADGAANYLPVT